MVSQVERDRAVSEETPFLKVRKKWARDAKVTRRQRSQMAWDSARAGDS